MSSEFEDPLKDLAQIDWRIERLPAPKALPDEITVRYPWLPETYRKLIEEAKSVVSPSDKAWLLTVCDYSNTSDGAYAWNEWERQSLDAAADDEQWQRRIREFWDAHLPIVMSVKSGYSYFAIEYPSLKIVAGNEPEYEETIEIAGSIIEM